MQILTERMLLWYKAGLYQSSRCRDHLWSIPWRFQRTIWRPKNGSVINLIKAIKFFRFFAWPRLVMDFCCLMRKTVRLRKWTTQNWVYELKMKGNHTAGCVKIHQLSHHFSFTFRGKKPLGIDAKCVGSIWK